MAQQIIHPEHAAALEMWDAQGGDEYIQQQQLLQQQGAVATPSTASLSRNANSEGRGGEDEGEGFFGTVADIGKGVAAGIYDAGAEIVNTPGALINLARSEDNQLGNIAPSSDEISFLKVTTEAGRITKTITQVVTGIIGAGKFLKAAGLLQKAGTTTAIARGMTQGAIADFTVLDAYDEGVSNLIESHPDLANSFTGYLAIQGDESLAEAKFKHTLEGLLLGPVVEGALFVIGTTYKAIKAAPTQQKALEALLRGSDELEALTAKSELSITPPSSPTTPDTHALTEAVEEGLEASGGKVELNINGNVDDTLKAVSGDDIDNVTATATAPSSVELAATPYAKGQMTKARLKPKEMGELAKKALQGGGMTTKEILNGEFLIGNTDRIKFSTLEELYLHGEYAYAALEKTLKGKGVQTDKAVMKGSTEWLESMGFQGLVESAAHDRETSRNLAIRAMSYKIGAKTAGQGILSIQQQIMLHGSTPELVEAFEKVSKIYQDLSLASKDITTASARVTRNGRHNPDYLSADVMANIIKATGNDPEAVLRTLNHVRMTPFQRVLRNTTEYIINGLLSSPKTHAINIGSNTLKAALMPAETIAGGIRRGDKGAVVSGMKTYAGLGLFYKEAWKYAKIAWKTGENTLDASSRVLDTGNAKILSTYDTISKSIKEKRLLSGGDPSAPLDTWEEIQARALSFLGMPSRALGTMDEFFKQLNARANTYGRLHSEALATEWGRDLDKVAEFVQRGMDDAFGAGGKGLSPESLRYAQEATFTEPLRDGAHINLGQGISDLVKAVPALRLVMPFVRTPTNLIRDFVAHTPGLNLATKRFQDAIKAGGEQAARAEGAMATGALLWGSAATLAISGKMTGGYPKDPATRQAWVDAGIEPYSFRIGDIYVSYARLDPFATFFGIAADYAEYSRNWADSAKGNWASGAVLALGSNILSKSYLTGLTDLIDALGDQSVDSKAMQKYMQRSITMFLPYSSGLRFTRQLVDDPMREVRSSFDAILNAIPGTSHLLPVKHSWLTGKPISHNLFWGEHKGDTVTDELARLGDNLSVGAPLRKISGIELNGEQYSRLCQLQGTIKLGGLTMHERLEQAMKSSAYDMGRKRIPDMPGDLGNPRTEMVEKIITQYRKAAQRALLREDDSLKEATDKELRTRLAAKRGDGNTVKELLSMPSR